MILIAYFTLIHASLEGEGPVSAQTPLWVPLTILILIVLLFLWGITRGNVEDENLPQKEDMDNH